MFLLTLSKCTLTQTLTACLLLSTLLSISQTSYGQTPSAPTAASQSAIKANDGTPKSNIEFTYKNISDWHQSLESLEGPLSAHTLPTLANDNGHNTVQNVEKVQLRQRQLQLQLNNYLQLAESCQKQLSANLNDIDKELAAIGETELQDTHIVAMARDTLNKERVRHQRKITSCKLLSVKANKALEQLNKLSQQIKTQERLYRSSSIIDLIINVPHIQALDFFARASQTPNWGSGNFSHVQLAIWACGFTLLIPAMFFFFQYRGALLSRLDADNLIYRTLKTFFANNNILLVALTFISYSWLFLLARQLLSKTSTALEALLGVLELGVLALCMVNAFLYGRGKTGVIIDLGNPSLQSFRRHTRYLVVYFIINYLSHAWPEHIESNQITNDFFRFILFSLTIYSLAKILWPVLSNSPIKTIRPAKYFIPPTALSGLFLLCLGYFNLVEEFTKSTTYSYLLIFSGYVVFKLLSDFFDSLDEGRHAWQQNLKKSLDIDTNDIMPGVIWLRIALVLGVLIALTFLLTNEWGISTVNGNKILSYFASGFTLGQITIVPKQIFQSLIFIAITMSLLMWAKKQFELRLLSKSRLDIGARDALGSILTYALGFLAILIAISIAGVNLSNLAIVAGALSVGIGFGLQAIVNNFVSGLILLLERPIQKGDWVVIDNIEGHVKRISVRSTLIQTFDHADVIVPNSDLITHVVKNWTHKNHSGRISIPVDVSYGSNVEHVRDILIDIASQRSEIARGHGIAAPYVLLNAFGESAINLELRFFVRQINDKLSISSHVRFEILRRFREENIDIPFPQRVLHIEHDTTDTNLKPTNN